MPERIVVSNTSPLQYLHQVGRLDLLEKLYGEVLVPPAVQEELRAGERRGISVPDLDTTPWLRVQPLRDRTLIPTIVDLGPGEAEAIALSLFHAADLLILDDGLGRQIARLSGLTCTGTLGVLLKAKQSGLLSRVSPILRELQKTTMWLGKDLVALVLAEAGE